MQATGLEGLTAGLFSVYLECQILKLQAESSHVIKIEISDNSREPGNYNLRSTALLCCVGRCS